MRLDRVHECYRQRQHNLYVIVSLTLLTLFLLITYFELVLRIRPTSLCEIII